MPGMGGSDMGMGGMGMGGMPGMGGMGMGGMGGGEMGYDPYSANAVQASPYRLFRFFDFTVQEGKRYRYRIKLMLINPNYSLDAKYVTDPKLTKPQLIETPWSEPTPEVAVLGQSGLLAGKVEPPRGSREAKATIIMEDEASDGSTVFKDFTLELGQLANFSGKNVDHYDWKTYSNQPVPSVDFKTDMMLVDLRGGEAVEGDKEFTEPGEMLFMTADGKLMVKTELDDWDRFSNNQQAMEALKNPNPQLGTGAMPGEAGYGGEGGFMPGGGTPGGAKSRRRD
jgi:hypothetical protein